jgi:ATP-binding cassette subfamily B (MDR/TAP) protein 1
MVKNKSIPIPFMTFCKLSKDMGIQNDVDLEVMWVIPFRNVIGSFMYAILCTRHDIAQAMGVVNQFMVNHV